MSVDEAQQGGVLSSTAVAPARRRRRSRTHRSLKRTQGVKKLQRILAIVFLGALVIAASLYFAQNFTQ
jgi:hypothetical protein